MPELTQEMESHRKLKVKSNGIAALDDQHELMEHESGLYLDHVHFNEQGAGMQGKQAAQIIRAPLFRSNR